MPAKVVVLLALAACGGRRELPGAPPPADADAARDDGGGRAGGEPLPLAPACVERDCAPFVVAELPIDRGTALAIDGAGFAYVGPLYGDEIFRVTIAGDGSATVLYRSPGRDIGAIEVRGELLRWSSHAAGTIYEAPRSGAGPIRVLADGLPGVWGFATDDRWIYWTDYGGSAPGMVWKAPIGGGPSIGLGKDPASRLATNVLLGGPDGDVVYSDRTPRLLRVPAGGGTPTPWAELPGRRESHALAQDATHVYMDTLSANEVVRVDRRTGRVELFARTETAPAALAVDASHVYWIDYVGPVKLHARRK